MKMICLYLINIPLVTFSVTSQLIGLSGLPLPPELISEIFIFEGKSSNLTFQIG